MASVHPSKAYMLHNFHTLLVSKIEGILLPRVDVDTILYIVQIAIGVLVSKYVYFSYVKQR